MGKIAGGTGGFSGDIAGGVGGKGEEFHDQHVGRVWKFEEVGDRKGGTGVDSSEESLGTEEVDRIGHDVTDEAEDSRILLGDCRVVIEEENCIGVGGLKSCSISGESHLNICLSKSCSSSSESHVNICLKTASETPYAEFVAFSMMCVVKSTNLH